MFTACDTPVRVRLDVPGYPELLPPYRAEGRVVGTLVGWIGGGPVRVAVVRVGRHLVLRNFHECEVLADA